MSEKDILSDISKKLDKLIALTQIGLGSELDSLIIELRKDVVSSKILEYTDGVISAGELQKKVSDETNVSERTVKRRLSELAAKGLLLTKRSGTNIYYVNSGIIEV